MQRFLMVSVVASTLVTALGGCSSKPARPATYPVTGTVTWKGAPLAGATVVLVPTTQGLEAAVGVTDAQGKFKVTTYGGGDGAQAGQYGVKVSKYDSATPAGETPAREITPEEEQALEFATDERPMPPARNLLPKKYESETTSGITHTVGKGPTTLDIVIND
jgi:hypothetical protein